MYAIFSEVFMSFEHFWLVRKHAPQLKLKHSPSPHPPGKSEAISWLLVIYDFLGGGGYFNSRKEFKELFFRSKNHPRLGVNIEELKYPKKGVILHLKFLLHFWSYNNSLKITVNAGVKSPF